MKRSECEAWLTNERLSAINRMRLKNGASALSRDEAVELLRWNTEDDFLELERRLDAVIAKEPTA